MFMESCPYMKRKIVVKRKIGQENQRKVQKYLKDYVDKLWQAQEGGRKLGTYETAIQEQVLIKVLIYFIYQYWMERNKDNWRYN